VYLGISLLPLISLHANPFRDVPEDHFAYEAIEKLSQSGIMGGYPDGTFKGRKVMTRYEVAVILAKIMARIEDARSRGQTVQIAPDNQALMSRLGTEFRTELDLLGVRIDSLEGRMQKVEEKTRTLDSQLSNVHIEGFYEGTQEYIARSNQYTGFQDPGLGKLNHDVFLRFIGNPREGDAFYKQVEAFVEIKANLRGFARERLDYQFAERPIPGDRVDDFATGIVNERDVYVNKAHFTSKAPLMNLRIFTGEQLTDLKDPAILLTASNFRVRPWLLQDGIFSGVEASGGYKKWAYFGSVLKRTIFVTPENVDPNNLVSEFAKEKDIIDDVFAFRTTYQALSVKDRGIQKDLVLGGTVVENAKNYNTLNEFHRIIGWDAKYTAKGKTNFAMTANTLLSEGRGDIHDSGLKLDSQYENGNLLLTFKGYNFGKDFRAGDVASSQFIDVYDPVENPINFGRGFFNTTGEKLLRLSAKYSFEEGGLSVLDDLTMTLTGLLKWWEDIPGQELQPWYGRRGSRINLRTAGNLNDRTRLEIFNETIKEAKPDEKGRTKHKIDMDIKLNKEVSTLGSITFVTDYDEMVQNQHYTKTEGLLEVSALVHPRLTLKGRVTDTVEWSGRPNQVDDDILDLEGNYKLLRNTSWRQYLRRHTHNETANVDNYSVRDYSISELNTNFSRKLQGSVAYSWLIRENIAQVGDDYWNWYSKLMYRPTSATEIVLTYGYDWDDVDHPGRFNFEHTRQKVHLRAQTDF